MEPHHLFLFLLSYLLTISATESSTVQISGPFKEDTRQLLSFKSTLPYPETLQNWQPNQNPCSFTGVSCKDSTRISSIDLSGVQLRADFRSISSFLLTLESLESLSLSSSNLTGSLLPLPTAGSSCSKLLAFLDLSRNSLSGSISNISSFRSCSALKSLNLSGNGFTFSGSDAAGGLHMPLQSLDLSFNRISGQNVLPWILSDCSELRLLNMKGNRVTGKIPAFGCATLEHLDLSANNFSGGIPMFVGNALQHLDLSSNGFSGTIGSELAGCRQLRFLNLSSNSFWGKMPPVPGGSLQRLLLSGNSFSGEIPPLLVKDACPTLLELDLSFNGLHGTLSSNLDLCHSLESLNLSNNNFSGEFPSITLSSMSNLKKLALSFNNLSGYLPGSMISNLTDLEMLDLSSNQFSGSIPLDLCRNKRNSLKELYLQNNLFTGVIPVTLSNCTQLISLDLSFNYLTGRVPSSLGSLSKLRNLIMQMNQLYGEIPTQLAGIRTLENLILDNNRLTGTIPAGLSNCSYLNWISLAGNQLGGKIPSWFGQLENLTILKLSNNSFSGSIPPEVGDCRSLIWLDLNSNHLNGTIPPSLAKQSGNIAVRWITGKNYVYLKTGGSPECPRTLNLLKFNGIRLDQLNRVPTPRSCNFTRVYMGNTLYTFNNKGSMIFLDLSYNQLEGRIPREIGSMHSLYVLNLEHNLLSGVILPDLGNLKSISILDLSHNSLEGPIPMSFTALSMLSEIDLSNNKLTGRIPELGQLATFPDYSYMNNSGLCGLPLPPCGHQNSHRRQPSLAGSGEEGEGSELVWFFTSMIIGFVVGFWGVCGVLLFKESWRIAYYRFLDNMKGRIFMS